MNVADLAKELELAPSTVLEQCARLGIDASWAGADLTSTQTVLLRAELAADEAPPAADEAPAPVAPPSEPTDAAPATSELPPTAVGSRPDLLAALAPEAAAGPTGPRRHELLGGAPTDPRLDDTLVRAPVGPDAPAATPRRRLDPALRPAVVGLVLAVIAAVGADQLDNAWLIAAVWLVAAVSLLVALLSANRARYRITTHPDQRRGMPVVVAVLVLGLLAVVGLGVAVRTVVGDAPAADAPLGLGDRPSVQHLRWGYHRLTLVASDGWNIPAKDVGTCWEDGGAGDGPRHDDRVEIGSHRTPCDQIHGAEVIGRYNVDRDLDSPYPGATALQELGAARCRSTARSLGGPKGGVFAVEIEYPTGAGWHDADHDVTCVAVADVRGSLLPD